MEEKSRLGKLTKAYINIRAQRQEAGDHIQDAGRWAQGAAG